MWGEGKGGVRQFVIEEQKGRETQMLLEVWMVIILKPLLTPYIRLKFKILAWFQKFILIFETFT